MLVGWVEHGDTQHQWPFVLSRRSRIEGWAKPAGLKNKTAGVARQQVTFSCVAKKK
jgi:hypothetical protein